jgi:NAD(P)-dependent dehydrogenase (short-subunit alcohol dehydrogenase family)
MKKIVIVTGGTKGIGKALVTYLQPEYEVWQVGRSRNDEAGRNYLVDLSKPADVWVMVSSIIRIPDLRVQALINNAGVNERLDSQWNWRQVQRHFNVNALAPFIITQALIQSGNLAEGSKVVNIGSYAGMEGHPNFVAYSMSKAAMLRWSESVSAHVQYPQVNTILPGRVNTPGNPERPVSDRNCYREPEDICPWVNWLLAQDSSGPNGQIFDLARR